MSEFGEHANISGASEEITAPIDTPALQEKLRVTSRPYQDERFAEIRKSGTSEGVYLGILGLDGMPQTEANLPDEVTLPYQLSDKLLEVRAASLAAGREQSQIIRWNGQGDFQFGRIRTGSAEGVRDLSRPLRTSRFASERPIVDFHTHIPDPTIYSYTDLRNLLKAQKPPYMTMIGTPRGGLALLGTAQFQPRKPLEAFDFTDELKRNGYSPYNLPKSAALLRRAGLGAYEWKPETRGDPADAGITLRKIDFSRYSKL